MKKKSKYLKCPALIANSLSLSQMPSWRAWAAVSSAPSSPGPSTVSSTPPSTPSSVAWTPASGSFARPKGMEDDLWEKLKMTFQKIEDDF